jgi:hypothetical protein
VLGTAYLAVELLVGLGYICVGAAIGTVLDEVFEPAIASLYR